MSSPVSPGRRKETPRAALAAHTALGGEGKMLIAPAMLTPAAAGTLKGCPWSRQGQTGSLLIAPPKPSNHPGPGQPSALRGSCSQAAAPVPKEMPNPKHSGQARPFLGLWGQIEGNARWNAAFEIRTKLWSSQRLEGRFAPRVLAQVFLSSSSVMPLPPQATSGTSICMEQVYCSQRKPLLEVPQTCKDPLSLATTAQVASKEASELCLTS